MNEPILPPCEDGDPWAGLAEALFEMMEGPFEDDDDE